MKNKKYLSMLFLLLFTFTLFACDSNTEYTANSEFYYSSDAGKTYGNRTKEFNVGETVYMQLIVKVDSTRKKANEVTLTLTIPSITAVDAKYYDGQPITPLPDEINNLTSYTFTVIASNNSSEWNFVFQFIPNSPGEITIKLEFDDNVPTLYDKQNTVKFIKIDNSDVDWE
jgi:hypothetical protein